MTVMGMIGCGVGAVRVGATVVMAVVMAGLMAIGVDVVMRRGCAVIMSVAMGRA
jgi:hypothetical protein